MLILTKIVESVENGNAPETKRLVEDALAKEIAPWAILNDGMVPALNILGEQLKDYTISLPEVMISVGAVRAGLEILKPVLVQTTEEQKGVAIIGTVQGDVHSLGKDLVIMMLEGNGFEVIDLGTDVSPARYIEAIQGHKADLVALSGLLTTSRLAMQDAIRAFEKAGLRKEIAVLVGGSSVDAQSAKAIGADAYGDEASVAPEIAFRLLKNKL
jgi:5-methyltetrahydrofolate--homocysteine methyltransferase